MSQLSATEFQRLWLIPDEVGGAWAARRRLAASLRTLIERCVTSDAGEEAFDAARAAVDASVAVLPPGRTALQSFQEGDYFDQPSVYVDRSALMGRANPIAPPMALRWEGQHAVRDITLTETYRGAPGMAHGGVVSAIFDQVGGYCMVMEGTSGFTAKLAVSYRLPTRLGVPLRFEAWVHERRGRRMFIRGQCTHGETVVATCEALFVEVDREQARAVIDGGPGA